MSKSPQTHANKILQYAGAEPLSVVQGDNTNAIKRSWYRCLNIHKLDPLALPRKHVESGKELARARDELGEVRTIAKASLEKLARDNEGYGYALLTNAQGIIVEVVANAAWTENAAEAGIIPGANWLEEISGTNGVGVCLVDQCPTSCHLGEHFHLTHLEFSCSSAPLFSPDGTFIGVLNVSSVPAPGGQGERNVSRLWAKQYGGMIDSAAFINHFRNDWVLRLSHSTELLSVASDLLLAVNADGIVVGATADARKMFKDIFESEKGQKQSDLIGAHLTSLLQCGYGDIWQLTRQDAPSEPTLMRAFDDTLLFVSASPPREKKVRSKAEQHDRSDYSTLSQLASNDNEMKRILDNARRLVNKNVNILIQGETGSGKEVLARALHDSSSRAKRPFVAINCAAIPESLIESELFGYTPGTFTGARSKGMQGLIERSSGGTLFLDEIGDMPLHLQTRLLRVLSEREVLPLGAKTPILIDMTVISASHRDLRKLIASGAFREDLYYRLCGATLALPALRDRHDKEYIVRRILEQEAKEFGCQATIDDAALNLLTRYKWPGNVRELRNVVKFALAISDGKITPEHLPDEVTNENWQAAGLSEPPQLSSTPSEVQSSDQSAAGQLRECLRRNKWNITAVSAETGLCRTTIYRQMKRYGIVPPTRL